MIENRWQQKKIYNETFEDEEEENVNKYKLKKKNPVQSKYSNLNYKQTCLIHPKENENYNIFLL